MALRFTSAILLWLAVSIGWGQAFGRFGYNQSIDIPGMRVDRGGFVALDSLADKIKFPTASKSWTPTSTSDCEQMVSLSPAIGAPSKLGFSLLGQGFSLYFPTGIDLKIASIGAPYLSWEQGSVGDGIPTPKVQWLVLSFRDRQPPFVLGFMGEPTSLMVSGSPGAWELKSSRDFQGWVKVGLPVGLEPQLANTSGALGRLASIAASQATIWTHPAPKLVKMSLESDLHSVTANWRFDRPGAVVPSPASLANLGNYMLKVNSRTRRLPGWNECGPIDVVDGTQLNIRFPIKRVPTGRSLTIGTQLSDPIGTVSPIDTESVSELALESLVAGRDNLTKKSGEEAVAEYLSQASFFSEPWTQQQLPFDAYGHGLDLAAAHAFLMQATTSTSRATSESNSLLTSISWRQDWLTWRVWTSDEKIAQRTGALAALAGALCPEPERRLTAAMFQAGLSAQRGLGVWRRRRGMIESEPKLIEPLYGVRKGLFGLEGPVEEGEAFALSLLSPMRVFSEQSVNLTRLGPDLLLQWAAVEAKPSVITLASAYQIAAVAHTNLSHLKVEEALGFTELHFVPETAGVCEIKINLPEYAKLPGDIVKVPTYSETPR